MHSERYEGKALNVKGVPKRGEVIWKKLEGEAVLLNPTTGDYFGLNEVACSFWEKVDGRRSLDEILCELLEEYDVEREELEDDIEELIEKMRTHNLILLE